MAAHGQVLPLHELTVGDVLDGAFRLVRERLGRIAVLVLVVLGPAHLLLSFVLQQIVPGAATGLDPMEALEVEAGDGLLALWLVTVVVTSLAYVVVAGAVLRLVIDEDRGARPALPAVLAAGLRRAPGIVTAIVLIALGAAVVLLGLLLLAAVLGAVAGPVSLVVAPVVPLVVLVAVAATVLVFPTAIVEGAAGPLRVVARVTSLLRRRLWRTVGVVALLLLVLFVVTLAISLLLGLLVAAAGPAAWVVDGVSGALVSVITTPVTVFTALLLYVDARVRLEGWDLELRAGRPAPW